MSILTGLPVLDSLQQRIQDEALLAPIRPSGAGIEFIDQTQLPFQVQTRVAHSPEEVAQAIRRMQIRGSGAIGCAGAFGAYLAVRHDPNRTEGWLASTSALRHARPTAIILQTAVTEVLEAAASADPNSRLEAAASAAAGFFLRQLSMERAIGKFGAECIPDGTTILTHCNSGALAGAGYGGRALSVIRAAAEAGKRIRVISQETRPYLQGARITAWELVQLKIPVQLATDGMAGALMEKGLVQVCVVGSDRVAANGDLVNKVGTYLIALAAGEHGVPFYTASTRYNVDLTCPSGDQIPIEMRSGEEVLTYLGNPISVPGVSGIYPAFDITPARLLSGIITENGVLHAPFEEALVELAHSGTISD